MNDSPLKLPRSGVCPPNNLTFSIMERFDFLQIQHCNTVPQGEREGGRKNARCLLTDMSGISFFISGLNPHLLNKFSSYESE